jgi:hypothetical protein
VAVNWGGLPVVVVPPESAGALCKGNPETLYGYDHLSLVKPPAVDTEPYRRLYNRFSRCVATSLNPDVASQDAQSTEGQKVSPWFYNLTNLLTLSRAPDGSDAIAAIRGNLFRRTYGDVYIATDAMDIPNATVGANGIMNLNVFSGWFWEHIRNQVSSLAIVWISRVSGLEHHVHDHKILELRTRFLAAGALLDDDYALAVAASNVDTDARFVLLVGFQNDNDQVGVPRLKGYFYLPAERKTCD